MCNEQNSTGTGFFGGRTFSTSIVIPPILHSHLPIIRHEDSVPSEGHSSTGKQWHTTKRILFLINIDWCIWFDDTSTEHYGNKDIMWHTLPIHNWKQREELILEEFLIVAFVFQNSCLRRYYSIPIGKFLPMIRRVMMSLSLRSSSKRRLESSVAQP